VESLVELVERDPGVGRRSRVDDLAGPLALFRPAEVLANDRGAGAAVALRIAGRHVLGGSLRALTRHRPAIPVFVAALVARRRGRGVRAGTVRAAGGLGCRCAVLGREPSGPLLV